MRSARRLLAMVGPWMGLVLTAGAVQADSWYTESGTASYYGKGFQGRKTASGERFSQQEMTAAHRQLPLGTKVMIKNLETGEQVEVKITDRGPYADKKHRIIDLSKAAAESIGLVEPGVAPVRVTVTEAAAEQQKSPEEEVVYEVQVAAFDQRDQAKVVLAQVQDWFPKTYMAPRQGPAGAYYRVRVGPFTTKEAAQKVANALKRGGHRVFLDEVPETALPPEAPSPPMTQNERCPCVLLIMRGRSCAADAQGCTSTCQFFRQVSARRAEQLTASGWSVDPHLDGITMEV
jgi:peptidoglycan lytic transglycosylase